MLTSIADLIGEDLLSWIGGLLIGGFFGFFAQRSRFCLRAAAIEFSRGQAGQRLAVWLLTFAGALMGTQLLVALGWLDVSEARQLAQQGSISGALIGGLVFGCGMVLARGCASRLLVLSANGNLRALLSGLVFAVAAQAAYRGGLSPAREWLTNLWLINGGPSRDIMSLVGGGTAEKLAFSAIWLLGRIWFRVPQPSCSAAALVCAADWPGRRRGLAFHLSAIAILLCSRGAEESRIQRAVCRGPGRGA
ncbi:hypothetical protein ACVWW1_003468 [Bradyrhizobium sp. JR3.5]